MATATTMTRRGFLRGGAADEWRYSVCPVRNLVFSHAAIIGPAISNGVCRR